MPDILIYSEIQSGSAAQIVRDLAAHKSKSITARINSGGGSVPDGFAIFNAFVRHGDVSVHIDGVALSIASFIACGARRVIAAENALIMLHMPWWGDVSGNASELRSAAATLDQFAEQMVNGYAGKTGKTSAQITKLLEQETWYTAAEALAFGLVDEIAPACLAAACFLSYADRWPAITRKLNMPESNTPGTTPAASGTPAPNAAAAAAASLPAPTAGGTPAPSAAADLGVQAAVQAALIAERTRRTEVRSVFAKFLDHQGMRTVAQIAEDDPSVTLQVAQARLLAQLGHGSEPLGGALGPRAEWGGNEHHDVFKTAAGDGLAMRLGIAIKDPSPEAQKMRRLPLARLAESCLNVAGVSTRMMSPGDIVATSFTHTTSDFPKLLGGAVNRVLLDEFEQEAQTGRAWTGEFELQDFRETSLLRLGEFSSLDLVREDDEYRRGTLPKEAEVRTRLETFGKMFGISRQAILNDDLNAIERILREMGRSAARLENDAVYDLLLKNPDIDGSPLFSAQHGNIAAVAGPVAITTLNAARQQMALQKGQDGKTLLNVRPSIVLTPIAQVTTVEMLLQGVWSSPTPEGGQGPWLKGLRVVTDGRLDQADPKAWYLVGEPRTYPSVVRCYLNGERLPFVDQRDGWDVDGTEFKIRFDFAAVAVDHRGIVKNPGA